MWERIFCPTLSSPQLKDVCRAFVMKGCKPTRPICSNHQRYSRPRGEERRSLRAWSISACRTFSFSFCLRKRRFCSLSSSIMVWSLCKGMAHVTRALQNFCRGPRMGDCQLSAFTPVGVPGGLAAAVCDPLVGIKWRLICPSIPPFFPYQNFIAPRSDEFSKLLFAKCKVFGSGTGPAPVHDQSAIHINSPDL